MLQVFKVFIKQVIMTLAIRCRFYSMRRSGKVGRIVILMYHKVNPERDVLGLSVSPLFFDQQLEFLASRYKVISLTEAVMMLSAGTISGDFAVITFDDGYRDNYDHAYPILKKHNVPATIFVTVEALETGNFGWNAFDQAILGSERKTIDLTEFALGIVDIGTRAKKINEISRLHHELKLCAHQKRDAVVRKVSSELASSTHGDRIMLSWQEAKEMQASGLVTIGSHTMTHPILTRVDHDSARSEIARSKSMIEERLGAPVELFAYPNGKEDNFDEDIIEMLKDAGYSSACTTIPGSIVGGENFFRLPRVDVTFGMCEGIGGRFSPAMFEVALAR